jgi:hypothetical protein
VNEDALQLRLSISSVNTLALSAAKKVTNTTEIGDKIWFAKINARPELPNDIRQLARAQES